jgi:DNA-directed RNA polymerase
MLQDLFEGLNVLSETEWSINKDLFEVVLKVWQAGGGIGALPKRQDDPVPERPFDVDPANMDKETAAEFRKWKKEVEKIRQGNRDLHSLRCDMLYKLQVARDFQDRSFFFPHNVDFRGRAYPIPPHLNHLGADINRGLLLFTVRKPITERGIFWLKVHLANLYGKDKYSFDERIQFVDENLHNIMKSADNPLPGLDLELNADDIYNSIHRTTTTNTSIKKLRIEECWWLQSENPWQTLAACIELTKCLRSPNPAEYETGLPIQMDGSCNGLQHYAALGRDNLGGLHVNLLPTEKPMDVYVGVLEVVKKHVDKDAANGNELAKLLQGNVYRSTIKQTVMTSVYGVTFVGAREQIYRRVREKKDIPEDKLYAASIYLASVTLHSLGEIFQSAKGIMDWLNEVAHIVTSANQPVIWITPLGLPVVQPYRSARKTCVKTVLQNVTLTSMSDELPVNQARQKSAFPPNYVHSLDASHMFMTARECKKRGIEFASVHDSFWTHPADVDTMNSIIREEFIKLHSQPLLETLLDALKKLHPGLKFPPVPKQGGLKLERVRDSPYFFD